MKPAIAASVLVLLLTGCTTYTVNTGAGLEPIPGSITYGGQPRTRLEKSPIGSSLTHEFRNQWGEIVRETYILQPDRSLKIVDRYIVRERMWD